MEAADSQVAIAPNVVATDFGGGLALLDLKTNNYFSLDEVGAFVWGVIQTPCSKGEIVQALVDEYDIEPEICARDIDALLEDLRNAALIETRPQQPS